MEYHLFWILYALIFVAGSVVTVDKVVENDCAKYGEITKVEVKQEGLSCYEKRGDSWVIKGSNS
jgi:hypothetical protein